MSFYFETKHLCVGYNGKALIGDINIELPKGKIMTLIGPHGAGKSTILKSITKHLTPVSGESFIDSKELGRWDNKAFAQKAAVVLTERVRPELMTCAEVVSMGRYPYTGMFGRLTDDDKLIVEDALKKVHALSLAGQDFSTLSDGQRQRIMLARAICQQPEVIILDEPTAYLDIRHKIELLDILSTMSREENITVIMSLHEIDLAMKASDFLLCVKGDRIAGFGTPEEVLASKSIEALYDMDKGSFDAMFGSVELKKTDGNPEVFVVGGAGTGIVWYRTLQKHRIPFSCGIIYENDLDYPVASRLSDSIVVAPAFTEMNEAQYERALKLLSASKYYIDAGAPRGALNSFNEKLIAYAKEKGIPDWRDTL
ncbi:MAG: ABC transporter ATP-binding protein [Oscillospiraceae bacterium]|nr:ABC transporter ATP-binding protein [Oscillospiraceae bacterium]